MSKKSKKETKDADDDDMKLNELTVPIYVSHVKPGSTLATNGELIVIQDGSTTIEVRTPPKFQPKRIPWRDGLIRDIAWCSELRVFFLLTQKGLFAFDSQALVAQPTTTINTEIQPKVISYTKIKPMDDAHSFWRCACVGKTLYICYAGLGTIVDEYHIERKSCELIYRWLPPHSCAIEEGIWCIRHHPDTNQLGLTIMDSQTNQWHFDIRDPKTFALIWRSPLPINHGDCELTPMEKGEWLIVNSVGIRLVQIVDRTIKAAVEYERELRNAISVGKEYLIVRTKNTIEVHLNKKKDG